MIACSKARLRRADACPLHGPGNLDLRGDVPGATDRFFVDTNVWFWTVYGRVGLSSRPPAFYQIRAYPAYLKAALAARSDCAGIVLFTANRIVIAAAQAQGKLLKR